MPEPRIAITIRPGTLDDVPFLDSLQKLHTKQVGWMPTAQFEGKVKAGHVLIAEESVDCGMWNVEGSEPQSTIHRPQSPTRVGYCIGNDQYFKRDDVGIIYQMNVAPGKQRGLIGATLLKAMFDHAAYGCKLFCCWCAQDIEANRFWESCGFVPLAFRTGSRTKGKNGSPRVHIFWQKRIREADTETPWWFPSQTSGGSIREDRLVFPIPPGVHWSDAKPIVLPGSSVGILPAPKEKKKRIRAAEAPALRGMAAGSLHFEIAKPIDGENAIIVKPKREKRVKQKNDPKLIAAARELRDRWLEQVNGEELAFPRGKYEVSRQITGPEQASVVVAKNLTLAA